MPNRLAGESSPYLLQHQANPVDWYPWGEEALARAKAEERPIFLSIGYSACHWCHVMEHESFENEAIAELMNREFVCIKVDREERPDLDQIYMTAVQAMTGRGGWPMSVFLTPELKPFYGGTYWPPTAGRGMPGFDQVLLAVADAWKNRRNEVHEQAAGLTEHVQQIGAARLAAAPHAAETPLDGDLVVRAAHALSRVFDSQYGGFGGAPKFPHAMDLMVILRVWAAYGNDDIAHMVRLTLDRMHAGGMYDHLGGGFARYAVDERWLVPHFEKMLYDNALLVSVYLEGYQAFGEPRYAQVARETLDYLLRDMHDAAGGFYSAEDADSEGEEGKFYVWTPQEVDAVLGEQCGGTFRRVYGVTKEGNFDGHNILNLPTSLAQAAHMLQRPLDDLETELAESRATLLAVRSKRVRPGLDDKVLVSWNALAIDAFARAGGVLGEPAYTAAAVQTARFLQERLRRGDGRLLHTWRGGAAKLDAYLDDYAYLANAFVTLYEATFDSAWIVEALALVEVMQHHFADNEAGGFYFTADDHEQLIARSKDFFDQSVPSGNAMAALAITRLAKLTGRDDLRQLAERTLLAAKDVMMQAPSAAGQLLVALDLFDMPTAQIVILGEQDSTATRDAVAELWRCFIPNKVVAGGTSAQVAAASNTPLAPLFEGKSVGDKQPAVFVCRDFECQAPVAGLEAARDAWDALERRE
jgi:uncharacterized protein YyaL (SSP411 family)